MVHHTAHAANLALVHRIEMQLYIASGTRAKTCCKRLRTSDSSAWVDAEGGRLVEQPREASLSNQMRHPHSVSGSRPSWLCARADEGGENGKARGERERASSANRMHTLSIVWQTPLWQLCILRARSVVLCFLAFSRVLIRLSPASAVPRLALLLHCPCRLALLPSRD